MGVLRELTICLIKNNLCALPDETRFNAWMAAMLGIVVPFLGDKSAFKVFVKVRRKYKWTYDGVVNRVIGIVGLAVGIGRFVLSTH